MAREGELVDDGRTIRPSSGLAIRVRLRGSHGSPAAASSAVAASACTAGWHGDHVSAGADRAEEVDHVRDVVVEAEGPLGDGNVTGVVPIGDEHVVEGRRASCGRCPAAAMRSGRRKRRENQHARLFDVRRLREVEERPERRARDRFLVHRDAAASRPAPRRSQTAGARGGGRSAARARRRPAPPARSAPRAARRRGRAQRLTGGHGQHSPGGEILLRLIRRVEHGHPRAAGRRLSHLRAPGQMRAFARRCPRQA